MRWGLPALVLAAVLVSWPLEGMALIRVGGLDTPGSGDAVEVVGDLAFVAGEIEVPPPPGSRLPPEYHGVLRIIDLSNPALPVEIGTLETETPGLFFDVEVAGDRAYVTGNDGLHVIDVSNPTLPAEIGALGAGGGFDVELVGGLAYVATGPGLLVIDVSDPALPVEICTIDAVGSAWDVEVVGGLAYVATGPGLRVIDVSNPCLPVEIGSLETGSGFEVAVVGDRAYLVTGDALLVLDVSDPAHPVALGVFTPPGPVSLFGFGFDVEAASGRAYLATSDGLLVLDVSNPALPVEILTIATPASDVELVDDRVYVAGSVLAIVAGRQVPHHGVLSVIDVSNLAFPVEIGSHETPWTAHAVERVGDLAYVAGCTRVRILPPDPTWLLSCGLRVIDVSNPALPVELGGLDWEGDSYANQMEVVGDWVYVATGTGLRVIDVSNPALPGELCVVPMTSLVRDVEVVGNRAYVLLGAELRVIDVSDPCLPVELGTLEMPAMANDLEVAGDRAYLVASIRVPPPEPPEPLQRHGVLRVIDVSDPGIPVEIGNVEAPGGFYDVAVVGDRAYVAGDALRVIDVSDPEHPMEIGALETPWSMTEIEVVGDRAYVVSPRYPGRGLVGMIDISNPAHPVELVALALPTETDARAAPAYDVEVVGELAYVAGGIEVLVPFPPEEGLHDYGVLRVIEFGPEYRTPIAVEIDIQPWSRANRIKPFSRELIPVALLGSESFDVADIDLTRLGFGPRRAPPALDPANPWALFFSRWDVNRDGRKDLLSYYRSQDTGIAIGDTQACLTGKMLDGTPLRGCDAIATLPGCGHGFEAALVLPPLVWIGGRIRRRWRRGV